MSVAVQPSAPETMSPPPAGGELTAPSAADEQPMSLGDSTMLRLLFFFFALLTLAIFFDLLLGFWRR